MISEEAEALIRRLLDGGCYYDREIAQMAGVSTETVRARRYGFVAHRRRGTCKAPRGKAPEITPPDENSELVWCSQCKAQVRLPCLVCQLRAIGRAVGHGDRYHAPIDLDLDNTNRTYPDDPAEHRTDRERYLEVLYARRCAELVYVPLEEDPRNLP